LWKNNRRNGRGVFYFGDGTTEEREYENDREINLGLSNSLIRDIADIR